MARTSPGGVYGQEPGRGVGGIVAVVLIAALLALLVWEFALGGFSAGITAPDGMNAPGTVATPAAPGTGPGAPGAGQPAAPGGAYGGGAAPTKP